MSLEKSLIKQAAQGNRSAQHTIYQNLSPVMLAVCRRYIRDVHFAEDVMITGFVKVFQHLNGFRNEGRFEGWVRRIMVREAIDFLRKRQFMVFEEELPELGNHYEEPSDILLVEQLERWVEALPSGCRTVFYLYAIEGYTHLEIANMLNISENTSKTQLHKARKNLQKRINHQKTQVL